MKIEQLRADKAAKLQAAESILATATDEAPISAEQQQQAEAYIQEAEELQKTLDGLPISVGSSMQLVVGPNQELAARQLSSPSMHSPALLPRWP